MVAVFQPANIMLIMMIASTGEEDHQIFSLLDSLPGLWLLTSSKKKKKDLMPFEVGITIGYV